MSKDKDEVVVEGIKYDQNGKTFVVATIPHVLLRDVSFVVPYTSKTPHGDQRFPSESRIEKFTNNIVKEGSVRPQSLFGTVTGGARFENISDKFVRVVLPKNRGKFIRLVDGQKGVESVNRAGTEIGDKWIWSVTLSDDDRDETMKRIHSDINMNAQIDDKAVDMHKAFDVSSLSPSEMKAGKIWDRMAEDKDSAIYHRVHRFHDDSNSNSCVTRGMVQFSGLVKALTQTREPSQKNGNTNIFEINEIDILTAEELYPLIKGCLKAWRQAEWKDCQVDIWNDPASYILGEPRGVLILSRTLRLVFDKCLRKYKNINLINCKEVIRSAASKVNYRIWQKRNGKMNTAGHIYLELKKKIGFHTRFHKK